ncbi:putative DNA-invertase from lambdoid prophage Rac [Sphaerotilus hippei]|uniref:Putative DNA-invertase from lambdoid prophage Rac n=1 Tax=Sphaerotilus hippei TaxID=744406 RepID=A0A318GY41_9BURK|nr:recombinase family protein [Sphaerotilus hippei]PXW94214.1 putative DNA-invertase from lambdoid prophage Rac [Sphaerotilus hippei]
MAHIAYYRVSTLGQSITAQREALLKEVGQEGFLKEYQDEGVSGGVAAMSRPGFRQMSESIRAGDTLYVYAIDRLGRDAIDVQSTVGDLIKRSVTVYILGLGPIAKGVGELIVAVLAQVAKMEKDRINERAQDGRAAARDSMAKTGKTHRGKDRLGGRAHKVLPAELKGWRAANGKDGKPASISETAKHFDVSEATVKRYTSTSASA